MISLSTDCSKFRMGLSKMSFLYRLGLRKTLYNKILLNSFLQYNPITSHIRNFRPYFFALLFFFSLHIILAENDFIQLRFKREFMYSSGQNASDPECFQSCNNEWRREFEENFKVNCTEFYDFPFHPKILQYAEYLKYCEIAEKQTKCFLEKCEDQSADRVFSPSNFLCHFKRTQFLSARPCLEDTEPITFLKCDEFCHKKAVEEVKQINRASIGKVFTNGELDKYENELSLLCSFQECYRECHRPIIEEVCSSTLADASIDLIQAYVQWHATDIYDWHILSENIDKLPASCARLTGYKPEEDPVLDIMNSIT